MIKTIDDLLDKYTSDPHHLTPEEVITQCEIVQDLIIQAHLYVKTQTEESYGDYQEEWFCINEVCSQRKHDVYVIINH